MMECNEVTMALNAYIDEELSTDKIKQLELHLATCSHCQLKQQQLSNLRASITSSDSYYHAPGYLKKQLKFGQDHSKRGSALFFPGRLIYALPIFVLGLLLGIFGSSQLGGSNESEFLLELSSSHVNSLMANHLTDVDSSDSHTVKPWFNGQLDFSPAVNDLAQKGYPLIGGRLEYLRSKPAAALVYKRRKHIINLFILANSTDDLSIKPESSNGYQMVAWNKSGLSYWAISDLNIKELKEFTQLYEEAAN
jgi:anti-sigma factor RsiW